MEKFWRTAAIVMAAIALLLAIGLKLQSRMEKVKTITIEKTQFIKKNIYTIRHEVYSPDTGKLTNVTEETTDKTEQSNKDTTKDKETEKPVSKAFVVTIGYDIRSGTASAGAGVVLFDFLTVQAINPVALKFDPSVMASILF